MHINADSPIVLRVAVEHHVTTLPENFKASLIKSGYLTDSGRITDAGVSRALSASRDALTGKDNALAGMWFALMCMGESEDRTAPTREWRMWTGNGSQPIPLGQDGWMLHAVGCGIDTDRSSDPTDEQWIRYNGDTYEDSGYAQNSITGYVSCKCGKVQRKKVSANVSGNLAEFITTACDFTGFMMRCAITSISESGE
jgi:hypothetical protein